MVDPFLARSYTNMGICSASRNSFMSGALPV
jgi:hypothetical protein